MKVLVTGGAGYIGSHTVKLLLEKKHQVVVVDNLVRGYYQPIKVLQEKFGSQNLVFYRADLKDSSSLEEIFKKEKPRGVVHFAALCRVGESVAKPADYFENNVVGSLNLLKAMKKNKVNYLVFSSTAAVFGESQYLPVDEKHPTEPTNSYGESKLIVERMVKWFGRSYGLKYVILRYFNVAGAAADGSIGDSKKPSGHLVQNAVRGALGIEPFELTCPRVGTPDGTPIRDYVNVEDLAEGHLLALDFLLKRKKSGVFNLGTGKGNSVLEIVNQVREITGVKFPLTKGQVRQGEYAQIHASTEKAKKVLNWKPKRTIRDSVLSLVKWYRNHPQGWES